MKSFIKKIVLAFAIYFSFFGIVSAEGVYDVLKNGDIIIGNSIFRNGTWVSATRASKAGALYTKNTGSIEVKTYKYVTKNVWYELNEEGAYKILNKSQIENIEKDLKLYYINNNNVISYLIEYDLKGGYGSNSLSYNINDENIILNAPYKLDYMFDGWTGSNGSEKESEIIISNMDTGNKKYIANWKPYNYIINEVEEEFKDTYSENQIYVIGEISSYKIDNVYGNWFTYKFVFDDIDINSLNFSYKYFKNVIFKKNLEENFIIAYIDCDREYYSNGVITYENNNEIKDIWLGINYYPSNNYIENYNYDGDLIPFGIFNSNLELTDNTLRKHNFYFDDKTNRLYYGEDDDVYVKDNKSFKLLSIKNNTIIEKEIIGYLYVPRLATVHYYFANDDSFLDSKAFLLDNYRNDEVEIHYFFNREITSNEQDILDSLQKISNVTMFNDKDKWFK